MNIVLTPLLKKFMWTYPKKERKIDNHGTPQIYMVHHGGP